MKNYFEISLTIVLLSLKIIFLNIYWVFFSIFAYNLHSLYPIYCCSIQHMLRAVTWQQFDHSDKYSGMIGD